MAIILPNIFTPYIEGRERAIAANWNDRNQYNQVAQGELSNAFAYNTFDSRVATVDANAQTAQNRATVSNLETAIRQFQQPQFLNQAAVDAQVSDQYYSQLADQRAQYNVARATDANTLQPLQTEAARQQYLFQTQNPGGLRSLQQNLFPSGGQISPGVVTPQLPGQAQASQNQAQGDTGGLNRPTRIPSVPGDLSQLNQSINRNQTWIENNPGDERIDRFTNATQGDIFARQQQLREFAANPNVRQYAANLTDAGVAYRLGNAAALYKDPETGVVWLYPLDAQGNIVTQWGEQVGS